MINTDLTIESAHIGQENNKIVTCDDFLLDPSPLVEYAANAKFAASPMLRQRKGYPGVRAAMPIEVVEPMARAVEALVRAEFDVPEHLQCERPQSSLCLMAVPESQLGPYQTIPHFDTSNQYFFAGLLYLCGEEHGGTGFYKHNSTGYESVLPERSDLYLDACHTELNNKTINKRYFSESDEYYTKLGFVGAKFNRLAVYHGNLIHSGVVPSPNGLSLNPRTGRLTANVFLQFS
jgi:hypothetical protein